MPFGAISSIMNVAMAASTKIRSGGAQVAVLSSGLIGSITGSCVGTFLYVAASEWWLRGLDEGTFLGISSPLFRTGFRMVVFSAVIMVVVLFFRKGIMGGRELPDLFRRRRRPAGKEARGK